MLTAERAKEAKRAQRMRIKTQSGNLEPKIGHELRELTRIKPERGQKHYHSVTEPQPKTKIHHGGTETRRRSKPIFTTERRFRRCRNELRVETCVGLRTWSIVKQSGWQAIVECPLVPLCPSQSMTSVAAMNCLVASCPAKASSTPPERLCKYRQPSRA